MNLAIIGATGNVGRKTIEVLEKSNLKINRIFLIASEKSVGKKLLFKKKEIIKYIRLMVVFTNFILNIFKE